MGKPVDLRAVLGQLACLLGILVSLSVPAFQGVGPGPVVLVAASVAWIGAVALAARGTADLRLILGGALALRLLVGVGAPSLSDDVYRYLWEGDLVASGTSPYAHAPLDPELNGHRARLPALFEELNHPDVPAAYPPLAQAANALVAAAAHAGSEAPGLRGVPAMRLLYGLCDLLVLWPLAVLLRRAGRSRAWLVVWAWSPLVAVEFAGSAHFDSLAILLLATGLVLSSAPDAASGAPLAATSDRERRTGAGLACLTAAGLVKLLPFAALPYALRGPGWRRRTAWVFAGVLAAYLPFLALEPDRPAALFTGLGQYGRRWEGGSLVFRWVDGALRAASVPFVDPQAWSRAIVGAAWVACGVHAWRRRLAPLEATALLVAAFLVLSPTLHPWYVTWILPFVALRPRAAWLWLASAAPLLYWPLAGWKERGEWIEPAWLWPAVALPFFLLLARERGRPPGRKLEREAGA